MAEGDGARLAAVLTADAYLEVRLNAAPALRADLDELADAVAVEDLERVVGQHLRLDVDREEAARVVAREPEGGLREVVRAEGEEGGVIECRPSGSCAPVDAATTFAQRIYGVKSGDYGNIVGFE